MRGLYIASIEMERNQKSFRIIIKTSRPGIIIGRSGEGSVKLRTVEKHTQSVYRQLGVTSRSEAMALLINESVELPPAA